MVITADSPLDNQCPATALIHKPGDAAKVSAKLQKTLRAPLAARSALPLRIFRPTRIAPIPAEFGSASHIRSDSHNAKSRAVEGHETDRQLETGRQVGNWQAGGKLAGGWETGRRVGSWQAGGKLAGRWETGRQVGSRQVSGKLVGGWETGRRETGRQVGSRQAGGKQAGEWETGRRETLRKAGRKWAGRRERSAGETGWRGEQAN
jgi:hypothetical protein